MDAWTCRLQFGTDFTADFGSIKEKGALGGLFEGACRMPACEATGDAVNQAGLEELHAGDWLLVLLVSCHECRLAIHFGLPLGFWAVA